MTLFRRYLLVKDDPGAFPRLEKDLLFYIEVQKFKVSFVNVGTKFSYCCEKVDAKFYDKFFEF